MTTDACTTRENSVENRERVPASILIPAQVPKTAPPIQAAILALAQPTNTRRLVRSARRHRSQHGSTPERRRTEQEGNEMLADVTEAEAPLQGDPLPEGALALGNNRGEGWVRRGGGVGSGRVRRPSSLERLRQRSEASPNNRGHQRTLERLEERQDSRRRSSRLTAKNSRPPLPVNRHSRNSGDAARGARNLANPDPARRNI